MRLRSAIVGMLLHGSMVAAFAQAQPQHGQHSEAISDSRNKLQKFMSAIAEGNEAIVRQNLLAGISANSSVSWGGFEMPALHLAQVQNYPRVMALLIQHGARLNDKFGPSQRTALHDAALYGRIECMRVLLSAGADPNSPNKFGRTPLGLATNPPLPLKSPVNVSQVEALLREYGGK
jgi:ankyrin repeat protein